MFQQSVCLLFAETEFEWKLLFTGSDFANASMIFFLLREAIFEREVAPLARQGQLRQPLFLFNEEGKKEVAS